MSSSVEEVIGYARTADGLQVYPLKSEPLRFFASKIVMVLC